MNITWNVTPTQNLHCLVPWSFLKTSRRCHISHEQQHLMNILWICEIEWNLPTLFWFHEVFSKLQEDVTFHINNNISWTFFEFVRLNGTYLHCFGFMKFSQNFKKMSHFTLTTSHEHSLNLWDWMEPTYIVLVSWSFVQ